MLRVIRKPFGYEPILTKEDIKGPGRKKGERASNWKSVLLRIWSLVDEQRALLLTVSSTRFRQFRFNAYRSFHGWENYRYPYCYITVRWAWRKNRNSYRGLYWFIGIDVFPKLLDGWDSSTNRLPFANKLIFTFTEVTGNIL